MCGIVGIFSKEKINEDTLKSAKIALKTLEQRGPDNQSFYLNKNVFLGHSRLSIIDISKQSNQPMFDENKQFVIIYNGEFYNYRKEREKLIKEGVEFSTNSDTEVLLKMYIFYGEDFIKKVNGCFAIAIYNLKENTVFLFRDRFGIKPLYLFQSENKIIFASELKAIAPFFSKKNSNNRLPGLEIDNVSLEEYFRFRYIPTHQSIYKKIKLLKPGTFAKITENEIIEEEYYHLPYTKKYVKDDYNLAKEKIVTLLKKAVSKRLVADVKLGTFLSGGIDSSIVSTLAAEETKNLQTFSIGYLDEPLFDETRYAEMVAKKIGSNHHTFKLKNKDLFDVLFNVLDYIDEPFADSSAIVVYLLSRETKKYVTVALSGDGADEICAGYNKHFAHYKSLNKGLTEYFIKYFGQFAGIFSESKNTKFGNFIRQIKKYNVGLELNDKDRYLEWLSIQSPEEVKFLLKQTHDIALRNEYEMEISKNIKDDFNDILYSDVKFLLPNDMLYKVDRMSMANGLEVRTPFLDYEFVNYLFSLPSHYKIERNTKKKILQDAFRTYLPEALYKRPKQGFDVPLLSWFRNELNKYIFDELFEKKKIEKQNIFNPSAIKHLEVKLNSNNPGNTTDKIWALIVFQYWYDKYFG